MVKNKLVGNLCRIENSLSERIKENVSRWNGNIVTIDEMRIVKNSKQEKSKNCLGVRRV